MGNLFSATGYLVESPSDLDELITESTFGGFEDMFQFDYFGQELIGAVHDSGNGVELWGTFVSMQHQPYLVALTPAYRGQTQISLTNWHIEEGDQNQYEFFLEGEDVKSGEEVVCRAVNLLQYGSIEALETRETLTVGLSGLMLKGRVISSSANVTEDSWAIEEELWELQRRFEEGDASAEQEFLKEYEKFIKKISRSKSNPEGLPHVHREFRHIEDFPDQSKADSSVEGGLAKNSLYRITGEVLDSRNFLNEETDTELLWMYVDVGPITIEIVINRDDLSGEPVHGSMLTGICWLEGFIGEEVQ